MLVERMEKELNGSNYLHARGLPRSYIITLWSTSLRIKETVIKILVKLKIRMLRKMK